MDRSAIFSDNRKYRYTLWRTWDTKLGYAMFIGLNPSTADETEDDPTIRRCIGFAKAWGYGALCMTNLFAYRATKPKDMQIADSPIGSENDHFLKSVATLASIVIAAWGINGSFLQRDQEVISLVPNKHVLRITKKGHPAHPLYLPKNITPVKWEQALKGECVTPETAIKKEIPGVEG